MDKNEAYEHLAQLYNESLQDHIDCVIVVIKNGRMSVSSVSKILIRHSIDPLESIGDTCKLNYESLLRR